MAQEACFYWWQNTISEAARKGLTGQTELEWDSYAAIKDQLKQEWRESVLRRKTMPKPHGSKRAPKSSDQRRRISEAIRAKWADPDYRERVHTGMVKHYRMPVGGDRKQRRKQPSDSSERRNPVRKSVKSEFGKSDSKSVIPLVAKKIKRAPVYRDPMVSRKLEMIKKIKDQRETLETKKREAAERAKLLIAEAENAAKSLEKVALKNPLAQASLMEAKSLIAKATELLEPIEQILLTMSDSSTGTKNPNPSSLGLNTANSTRDDLPINGKQITLNGTCSDHKNPSLDLSVDRPIVVNGSKWSEKMPEKKKSEMKWVCGKLVEVEED